jgi:hypothetical protein
MRKNRGRILIVAAVITTGAMGGVVACGDDDSSPNSPFVYLLDSGSDVTVAVDGNKPATPKSLCEACAAGDTCDSNFAVSATSRQPLYCSTKVCAFSAPPTCSLTGASTCPAPSVCTQTATGPYCRCAAEDAGVTPVDAGPDADASKAPDADAAVVEQPDADAAAEQPDADAAAEQPDADAGDADAD